MNPKVNYKSTTQIEILLIGALPASMQQSWDRCSDSDLGESNCLELPSIVVGSPFPLLLFTKNTGMLQTKNLQDKKIQKKNQQEPSLGRRKDGE